MSGKGSSPRQLQRKRKKRVDDHIREVFGKASSDRDEIERRSAEWRSAAEQVQIWQRCDADTHDGRRGSCDNNYGGEIFSETLAPSCKEVDTSYSVDMDTSLSELDSNETDFESLCSPEESSSEPRHTSSTAMQQTLSAQLALWAIQVGIPLQHLTSLLKILHSYHPDLPLDGRTLLSTPKAVEIEVMSEGEFIYFGILQGIQKLIDACHISSRMLSLQVNVDGLPLYRSRNTSFWPILVAVRECIPLIPFPAAVYCGGTKPYSVHSFLSSFVLEMENLLSEGFTYLGKSYRVSFHSLVCDTPARAFVKCIKGHTGYSACERCEVKGEYFAEGRKVIYRDESATNRTRQSFNAQTDPTHHNGESPLLSLQIDLVSQVPLDSMHLVYLGVVKKIVTQFWLTTTVIKTKLSHSARCMISEKLLCLKAYMPREFNRKPRALSECSMWKATEWRQFLLYTGPVVLKKNSSESCV